MRRKCVVSTHVYLCKHSRSLTLTSLVSKRVVVSLGWDARFPCEGLTRSETEKDLDRDDGILDHS